MSVLLICLKPNFYFDIFSIFAPDWALGAPAGERAEVMIAPILGPVVQWIECQIPVLLIGVRVSTGSP